MSIMIRDNREKSTIGKFPRYRITLTLQKVNKNYSESKTLDSISAMSLDEAEAKNFFERVRKAFAGFRI